MAALLQGRACGAAPLPPLAPEWATCRSCAATLADRVHRFQDAGYCKECHEEAVEMTPDSEDE